MKMKQSSQPLISIGMLPWGIDQWFFISSMMILMMLISNPISSSESMNCLRALTWKSRRPSFASNKHNLSLSCLGYRKDFRFPQEQVSGDQLQRPRPSLCSTRCSSRASTSSTQSTPLLPGTPPSWSSSALDSISSWTTLTPAWGRWWKRKTLPWEGRAPHWPWRGTSRASMSEREWTQWLGLGNCQSGNHEVLSVLTVS